MALIWMDGFDAYGTNGNNADSVLQEAGYFQYQDFWSEPFSTVTNDTRTGIGYALIVNTWGHWGGGLGRAFPIADGIVCGFSCKSLVSNYNRIIEFGYNNLLGTVSTQISIAVNGANGLTVQTGDTAHAYFTDPNVLFEGVWQYIEIKYLLTGGGTLQIKIDGVMKLNISGVTIQSAGLPSLVNQATFYTDAPTSLIIDDFYLCDTTGTEFNDFLGDCIVHNLLPVGDGGTNQMTQVGGDGTGHYSSINENPPDGDASYLYSNTSGQKELFTLPTLPTDIVDVLAVGVNVVARKQAAGLGTYQAVVDVGGLEETGPTIGASIDYVSIQSLFLTEPGGGNWTLTDLQNAKFGMKIV